MAVDDTLRIAGCPGGVVEGNRIPFVLGHAPAEGGITVGDQIFISEIRQGFWRLREFLVIIVHDQRFDAGLVQSRLHHRGKFPIANQHLGIGVVELKSNDGSVEPRVHGMQHRADHRHRVVGLEHRRCVGEHYRDGVTCSNAALRKGAGQSPRASVELGIGLPSAAVHQGNALRMNRRRALKERQR